MINLKVFLATLAYLVIMDTLFLGVIMKPFFSKELGAVSTLKFTWYAAAPIYILLALAVVMFTLPLVSSKLSALSYGALMGLIVYGTYELTNYAAFAAWPLKVVLLDSFWGIFSLGTATLIAWLIQNLK